MPAEIMRQLVTVQILLIKLIKDQEVGLFIAPEQPGKIKLLSRW